MIEYICRFYGGSAPMTQFRLGLTLYLTDWRSAIELGRAATDIRWKVENHNPTPEQGDLVFLVMARTSTPPDFSAIDHPREPLPVNFALPDEDRRTIDFVLKVTRHMADQELMQLVYSTFPIMTQPDRAPLNLVALAERYNREFRHQQR
ncbi:MAG TPA: hypothetical protein VGJ82_23165 [Thermoanaerobaculia bacterium]